MKRVVVMGHGGYAEGVKQSLDMIAGHSEHMYFIDLTKEDDLNTFQNKVNNLLESFNADDEVLFACDLLGASPFRIAAMICINKPGKYYTVAGLNTMAFLELNTENNLSIEEMTNHAIEVTKEAAVRFPEKLV